MNRTMPMQDDLLRIHYITANYDYFQGLRSLPWGILSLLVAGGTAGWNFFVPGKAGYLELVAILTCLGLYWTIGAYYKHRFGRVERATSRFWHNVLFFGAAALAIYLDVNADPPANLLTLTFAGWFLWMYIDWEERIHYLFIGSAFALLGLLPMLSFGALDPALWGSGGTAFYATLGLGMIIGGLFDHQLLAKTLPPVHDEPHDYERTNLSMES